MSPSLGTTRTGAPALACPWERDDVEGSALWRLWLEVHGANLCQLVLASAALLCIVKLCLSLLLYSGMLLQERSWTKTMRAAGNILLMKNGETMWGISSRGIMRSWSYSRGLH